jgi:hypothetical protein
MTQLANATAVDTSGRPAPETAIPGPSLDDILEATDTQAKPATMDRLARAKMLARCGFLPAHLRWATDPDRTVANAFMLICKADQWKMSEYDLGPHTFERNGRLCFDGLVIAAVVQNSGKLQGRLTFTHVGSGAGMLGTVSGALKGAKAPVSCQVSPWTGPTRSNAWDTDPVQMLWYRGVRQWARLYLPEIFFQIDGGEDEATPISARDLEAVKAELPRAADPLQIAEIFEAYRLLGVNEESVRLIFEREHGARNETELSYSQAHRYVTYLRDRLATRATAKASDHTTPPTAVAPSAPPAGGAPATLQEALAEQQRADAAAAKVAPPNGDLAIAKLYAVRDSYYALTGLGNVDDPAIKAKRVANWNATLAKRGYGPLSPPSPETVRELTETYERKVAELAEKQRLSGVSCGAKEPPARPVDDKRPTVGGKPVDSGEIPF